MLGTIQELTSKWTSGGKLCGAATGVATGIGPDPSLLTDADRVAFWEGRMVGLWLDTLVRGATDIEPTDRLGKTQNFVDDCPC